MNEEEKENVHISSVSESTVFSLMQIIASFSNVFRTTAIFLHQNNMKVWIKGATNRLFEEYKPNWINESLKGIILFIECWELSRSDVTFLARYEKCSSVAVQIIIQLFDKRHKFCKRKSFIFIVWEYRVPSVTKIPEILRFPSFQSIKPHFVRKMKNEQVV